MISRWPDRLEFFIYLLIPNILADLIEGVTGVELLVTEKLQELGCTGDCDVHDGFVTMTWYDDLINVITATTMQYTLKV